MNDEISSFLDEEDEDRPVLPKHALYRSTGETRLLIARFDNAVEAMLCMGPIGRALQTVVYLQSPDDPTKTLPLPRGCSVEQSGIVYRNTSWA